MSTSDTHSAPIYHFSRDEWAKVKLLAEQRFVHTDLDVDECFSTAIDFVNTLRDIRNPDASD